MWRISEENNCSFTVCGPGKYKGKIQLKPSLNAYCKHTNNGVDTCLTCPGMTIKAVSGDSRSLCVESCDGATNVPNKEHTACGNVPQHNDNIHCIASICKNWMSRIECR